MTLVFTVILAGLSCTPINITIVHTTDMHGWYYGHRHDASEDADIADLYSLITLMKAKQTEHNIVLAIDSGDLIDGTGFSELTRPKGRFVFDVMAKMPFDAMSIGNHELQNAESMTYMADSFVTAMSGRYLAGQTVHKSPSKSMGAPYRLVSLPNTQGRLLIIGFVLNMQSASTEVTQQTVETFLNDARLNPIWKDPTIKAIICPCHFGTNDGLVTTIKNKIRGHFPSTPVVFLCGHTHVTGVDTPDDNSISQQAGFYFHNLGIVSFQLDVSASKTSNSLSNSRFEQIETIHTSSFSGPNSQSFTHDLWNSPEAVSIRDFVNLKVQSLGLNTQIGCSPRTWILPKYGPKGTNEDRVFAMHLLRIRDDLKKGPVFVDDLYTIDMYNFAIYLFANITGSDLNALLISDSSMANTDDDGSTEWFMENGQLFHLGGSNIRTNRAKNGKFKDDHNVGKVTPTEGKIYDLFVDSNIAGIVQNKLNKIAPGKYSWKATGTTFRPIFRKYIEEEMKC
ncbi:putative Ser/Thr protein phosphatase family [Blattamonas nauphoetae]|uniref:Ser/Thr protein phosphatase family n=1 Tax=Blattamonas nauphoetae TaxID=2049346 RepID=A0ABQ9X6G1_9EUKA|nr:putative Ser/Thr protein phosphatase family [Blattamonas nauphoetae]